MKVYVVFGAEWHGCRELLGIFDDYDKALNFKEGELGKTYYDDITIVSYMLNEPNDTL